MQGRRATLLILMILAALAAILLFVALSAWFRWDMRVGETELSGWSEARPGWREGGTRFRERGRSYSIFRAGPLVWGIVIHPRDDHSGCWAND